MARKLIYCVAIYCYCPFGTSGMFFLSQVHIPQNVLPLGKRKLKDQMKFIQQSKPIYIKSYK